MAKVEIYGEKLCNWAASHHVETQNALRKAAREVEGRARGNLATARATTGWHKLSGPDHLTRVTSGRDNVDHFVILEAPNPMAIEFGHFPSGAFDPEVYGKMTKAPHGLYILTAAAYLGKSTSVSSGSGRRYRDGDKSKSTYTKRSGMYRKNKPTKKAKRRGRRR